MCIKWIFVNYDMQLFTAFIRDVVAAIVSDPTLDGSREFMSSIALFPF